ncbi:MAG: ABC transporter permease [Acidimicrobiia bacterium]|nr:ABC transporter permease [Acidimicrobiia bacterium]
MLRLFVRRILYGFLILNLMTVLLFVLVRLVPGDAVAIQLADAAVSEERIAELTAEFGLDVPIHSQLVDWYSGAITGDFGTSFSTGQSVASMVFGRLPLTLILTGLSVAIAIVLGIGAGVTSAIRRNGWVDNVVRFLSVLSLSLPNFWLGLMLLTITSVVWKWVPPLGWEGFVESPWTSIQQLFMPALALGASLGASIARLTRSSLLEVLGSDFIRTVRAKGAPERVVLYKHALRNSLIPVITLIGIQIGALLGGTVILESIFSLPGLGREVFGALNRRDYPVLQMGAILYGAIFIVVNIAVDLSYGLVNPRMRVRANGGTS